MVCVVVKIFNPILSEAMVFEYSIIAQLCNVFSLINNVLNLVIEISYFERVKEYRQFSGL